MSTETASKRNRSGRRNPVKNPGAPDRKAHSKLAARITDYAKMMDEKDPTGRKVSGGYHKPGSMQRH